MADDTRLAEACLLLNYSHQSYKEQMLLIANKQQSQQINPDLNEKAETMLDNNCEQLNEKTVPTKLITPPPEQDYIVESQDNASYSSSQCLESPPGSEVTVPCNLMAFDEDKLDDSSYQYYSSVETNTSKLINSQSNHYCDPAMEPINNLLAAVNCALPGLRSRPTILQRNSTSQIQSWDTIGLSTIHMPDHDYCHQEKDTFTTHGSHDLSCMTEQSPHCGTSNFDGISNYPSEFKKKREHSISSDFTSTNSTRPLKLVAVHLGAGNSHHDEESLNLAKKICEQVMLQTSAQPLSSSSKKRRKNSSNSYEQVHRDNQSQLNINSDKITAESAVVHLVKLMEDQQSLNCGFGSNLNIKGQVECDASLMSDETQMWAGVGAVSGCRNPILLAKSLYDHRLVPRPLSLIQPNLLVSSGAKQWMRERCSHLSVMDSKMVSSKSFSTYQKIKSKYDSAMKLTSPFYQERTSLNQSETQAKGSKYAHKKTLIDHSHAGSPLNRSQDYPTSRVVNYNSSTNLDHGFYCVAEHASESILSKPEPSCQIPVMKEESPEEADGPFSSKAKSTPRDYLIQTMEAHDFSGEENIDLLTSCSNHYRLDTVGAIAVDSNNNFASAISSGGILLKYKGRVGQAAVPGAGCWSEDSVAITTTGVGEYLTLSMFAKKFYDKMQTLRLLYDLGHVEKKPDLSDMINNGIEECFEDLMSSAALAHVDPRERLAGMLAVSTLNSKSSPDRVENQDLYLSYAHNTNSMCVGYMTCDDIVGHSVMSRQDLVPEAIDDERGTCEPLVRTVKFSLNMVNR